MPAEVLAALQILHLRDLAQLPIFAVRHQRYALTAALLGRFLPRLWPFDFYRTAFFFGRETPRYSRFQSVNSRRAHIWPALDSVKRQP
jgi:hypothetical protein